MFLSDVSIKRPVFATMMIAALVVFGIVSFPRMGVDLFPKVDFPIVTITAKLPGASPEIMELEVTDLIEEAVNTLNGVKNVTSASLESISQVFVEFVLEKDIEVAAQDVRDKIATIRSKLPKDIESPIVEKLDPNSTPILWVSVSGNKPIRELTKYADKVLKERIQKIPGVGSVELTGKRDREVKIWLDARKLDAYHITASDVTSALKLENVEIPGGRIENEKREVIVKTKGEFQEISEFNNLIISHRKGAFIRLKDIGWAEDGLEDQRSIARFNGKTAVGLQVRRQSGTNTLEVANSVKHELDIFKKDKPAGINIDIAFDQSTFIKESIDDVSRHIILGGILAVIIIFFFLRSFTSTIISAIAIPASVIATFAIMYLFGFTRNNMTMLALSLSVGMLIDDAIVVLENIFRHMEEGMKPTEAAHFATSEIGLAVMATTMSIVAVFIPVAFMSGIVGRFFYEFGVTVSTAVLISLLVSFTLTPMLCSRYLKVKEKHGKLYRWIESFLKGIDSIYRIILGLALRHRIITITAAIAIFIISLKMAGFLGTEFFPPQDMGRFVVRVETKIGTSIDESDRALMKVEKIVANLPEVESVFSALGLGVREEINKAMLYVNLKDKDERKKSQQYIMTFLRSNLRDIAGVKITVEDMSVVSAGRTNAPLQLAIKGNEIDKMAQISSVIISKLKKIPGFVDVDSDLELGKPEVRVYIDRAKASDLGVNAAAIAATLNTLVGSEVATKFKSEGERFDVRVRLKPDDRGKPQDISYLMVGSRNGNLIRLSNVVKIDEGSGPTLINRRDRQRIVTVLSNLDKKPLGDAVKDVNQIIGNVIPPGYSTKYVGMADIMKESFQNIFFALFLAVIIIYMVLASQFESFIHPFTIMLSLPFSLVGALGALLIAGKTINIISLIGIIMLMGLVTKNAILLVDYTNTLRSRGIERNEAILKAGPVRLRPILMTTSAMVMGMLPVALGLGSGAEQRAPMAVCVIGGLITSMFLTLVIVPVVYTLLDDLQARLKTK